MKRYIKNMNMLSEVENLKLKDHSVCVIGCGGLGGYIIEMLGRLGIGHITAVDNDCFDETNLNRQILASELTLGCSKALSAEERMKSVNPLVEVKPIQCKVQSDNINKIITGHDIVVDAVDSIDTRLLIQEACKDNSIPMVHGAIGGWYGQVSTILPGDDTLNKIYRNTEKKGVEDELGNPSFTPALVASIQVSEVLKVVLGRGELLKGKVLYIDLLDNDFITIDL